MRLIILFTLFLTACSTAYGQSNTQVNGDLTFEFRVLKILVQIFGKDLSNDSNKDLKQRADFKQRACFQMVG